MGRNPNIAHYSAAKAALLGLTWQQTREGLFMVSALTCPSRAAMASRPMRRMQHWVARV